MGQRTWFLSTLLLAVGCGDSSGGNESEAESEAESESESEGEGDDPCMVGRLALACEDVGSTLRRVACSAEELANGTTDHEPDLCDELCDGESACVEACTSCRYSTVAFEVEQCIEWCWESDPDPVADCEAGDLVESSDGVECGDQPGEEICGMSQVCCDLGEYGECSATDACKGTPAECDEPADCVSGICCAFDGGVRCLACCPYDVDFRFAVLACLAVSDCPTEQPRCCRGVDSSFGFCFDEELASEYEAADPDQSCD